MTMGQLFFQPAFRNTLRLSALTVSILAATHLQAQEDTTVVYEASFFDQYTPVSANDMISRIPGSISTTTGAAIAAASAPAAIC